MTDERVAGEPMSAAPGGSGRAGRATPELCARLAYTIHDDVLQSMALCMLQATLCRRLWESGQVPEALAELDAISGELDSAANVLRGIVTDLRAAAEAGSGLG